MSAINYSRGCHILPFLQKKQVAGIIVKNRKPDGSMEQEDSEPQESGNEGLEACAQDMIDCMHAKDAKGCAAAMRAAFEILDSQESSESEDNSFDAMNAKAAEESE